MYNIIKELHEEKIINAYKIILKIKYKSVKKKDVKKLIFKSKKYHNI